MKNDYQKNGKSIDIKYNAGQGVKVGKKNSGKSSQGFRQKKHVERAFIEKRSELLIVQFDKGCRKQLNE